MPKEINFLNSNMYRLIMRVSLPLVLASIVTSIVQLANVAFMGNLGSEEIYVRSLYTPFAFLLIALIEAFQISNQVSIARLNGERDREGIKNNIVSFVLLSIAVSLAVWMIIYFASPYIAQFYNVPNDVATKFKNFITLMFLVNIPGIVAMVLTSSFRGIGKLSLSMILSIGYALLNIILVYMYSFHWNKGIFSLVYANLISSLTLLLISIIALMKLDLLKIKKQYFKLHKKGLFFLKIVGIPIFISYIIIFISNFFYNKIIEPFGHTTLSGFSVGYYVQTFAIIPAIAIGSALGIIMNNNIGAGTSYYPRVYQTMKKGTLLTLAFYTIMSALIFIFKTNIAQLMLIDNETIQQAVLFLKIVAPTYICFGVVLMTITTLEQINKGYLALTLNGVYFIAIIIVGWYLTLKYTQVDYLYWTIAIMNIIGFISIFFILRMMKKQYNNPQMPESENFDFIVREYEPRYVTDVLNLFTESDFYFKTMNPNYLSKDEIINSIIEDETMIISSKEQVIGLVEIEAVMEAAKHYSINFRLSNTIDVEKCNYILKEIISSYTSKTKVIKLAASCNKLDEDYITVLKKNGFKVEGELDNLLQKDGESISIVYLHKLLMNQDSLEINDDEEGNDLNRFSENGRESNVTRI